MLHHILYSFYSLLNKSAITNIAINHTVNASTTNVIAHPLTTIVHNFIINARLLTIIARALKAIACTFNTIVRSLITIVRHLIAIEPHLTAIKCSLTINVYISLIIVQSYFKIKRLL